MLQAHVGVATRSEQQSYKPFRRCYKLYLRSYMQRAAVLQATLRRAFSPATAMALGGEVLVCNSVRSLWGWVRGLLLQAGGRASLPSVLERRSFLADGGAP